MVTKKILQIFHARERSETSISNIKLVQRHQVTIPECGEIIPLRIERNGRCGSVQGTGFNTDYILI